MIKFYHGDGAAEYEQIGVENYLYETELGKKGSELLNDLKVTCSSKDKNADIYKDYYENMYTLYNEGIHKIEKFYKEELQKFVPERIRNNKISIDVNSDRYDFLQINISIKDPTEEIEWNYYPFCTICHEIIIK